MSLRKYTKSEGSLAKEDKKSVEAAVEKVREVKNDSTSSKKIEDSK